MNTDRNRDAAEAGSQKPATRIRWEVAVVGDRADLATLADSFVDPDCCITEVNSEYVISSDSWNQIETAPEVRVKVEDFLSLLSGSTRLELGASGRLTAGCVYEARSDGLRNLNIFPTEATLEIRGFPATIIAAGEVHHAADFVRDDVQLADRDDRVSEVLRLWVEAPLDWDALYRVFELVERDCGNIIKQNAWANGKQCTRFTSTSNIHRHPARTDQRPKKPMTLDEARVFVEQLLRAWIEWKRKAKYTRVYR